MQRARRVWLTIREGEVNGDMNTDFAATHDVVKESHFLCFFEVFEVDGIVSANRMTLLRSSVN